MRNPRVKLADPIVLAAAVGRLIVGRIAVDVLFTPQVAIAAAVPKVPFVVLIEKSKLMQLEPPDPVVQPAVIVPLPEPPIVEFTVMWKVSPTWPAPETFDCVGGASTPTM